MKGSNHHKAAPVDYPFFTPGVWVMLGFMLVGLAFVIARYILGLGGVTNLTNQYPWGLWIGVDVATGVALAAGGFTTAFLAHILHNDYYEVVTRPALLTAMLGYTFVSLGLFVDIGRSYNIWHPMIYHQPNSVLFEVAMCVMTYLTVLYIEFIPMVCERFIGKVNLPGPLASLNGFVDKLLRFADKFLDKFMFIFIIAGVVLSCMHQSGLGSLLVIAPYKVHPLWYTPLLPFLFLLSAIAVGFPMVVFESFLASKSLHRELEMDVLSSLAKFTPILLGIYMAFKIGDLIHRGAYVYLLEGSVQSNSFLVEMIFGVIVPFAMLLSKKIRQSPMGLFVAMLLVVLGVALNRVNVFLVGFLPAYASHHYFPSIGEMAITAGLIAGLMFLYRACVTIFPVLPVVEKVDEK